MTFQEALTKSIQGILDQGEPSIGIDGCSYRGDGDTKCAIGMIIKDEFYDEDFEGLSVPVLSTDLPSVVDIEVKLINALNNSIFSPESNKKLTIEELRQLEVLQTAHDEASEKPRIIEDFNEVFKKKILFFVEKGFLSDYCLTIIKEWENKNGNI